MRRFLVPILALFAVICAVGWAWICRELSILRQSIAQLRIHEATISAKDAETGAALTPWFTWSVQPSIPGSLGFRISPVSNSSPERRVLWASATPLPINVGSEGYHGTEITIGDLSQEPSLIVVPLKRKEP